jgi:adenine-specific DNA-methyltransferase
MPDLRDSIQAALQAFAAAPLRDAATALLNILGYQSDRTLDLGNSTPSAFLDFITSSPQGDAFDPKKALFPDWTSADLLFQLTDKEISRETTLFPETEINPGLLRSYVFFAIELNGQSSVNGCYARSKLTAIARQINRVFPMPVMVFIKHPTPDGSVLSIAVINRRRNKVRADKDVLEKATIIRDISLADPHRGHQDILASFALPLLKHPKRLPVDNFDVLHLCWERIFNVELLNQNFYDDLANWFFWAKKYAHFPLYDELHDRYELFNDSDKVKEHESKNLIRLLTRILFVWFIKERGLVHESLFNVTDLERDILKKFDPESKDSNYYKAVIQNLFFATLNRPHGEREFRKEGQHHNITTLLRYEDRLQDPDSFLTVLEKHTPFLNGGLFDCLDRPHPTKMGKQGGKVIIYEDGFSDRKDNPLLVPDFLFFGKERETDLSDEESYGLPGKKRETVRGLIDILDSYKFTIVENTPIDQEVALDPELLGQVFENLLASYNDETKSTARKQTGSFYTPRGIVDYMVDESLKAYLSKFLIKEHSMTVAGANECLGILFGYTEKEFAFSSDQKATLIEAIDSCKILDPACGSGAFPMGALQKLVFILGKLDPRDELWEKRQLARVDRIIEAAQEIEDTTFRERAITDAEAQKRDIEEAFAKNELGYGRKLYLIENCLYGVDKQSIATQISKLRFFISLIVDQSVDRKRSNFGVRPLPNLEVKFVTADTLIKIEKPAADRYVGHGSLFERTEISPLQQKLKTVRHNLFSAKTPRTKEKYRELDHELREAIATELQKNGWDSEAARNLARWDPYNQNASAPYFDPEWMFGEKSFNIVIGNPPYISVERFAGTAEQARWQAQFKTYAARGDIYCFFYERGRDFLCDGGTLIYITSNKWMRAGYGEKLRGFLATDVNTQSVLDFGMAQNFGAATTYTCITRYTKEASQGRVMSCYATDDRAAISDPAGYFVANAVLQKDLGSDPWVVISAERQRIKHMVEALGIPLKKWNIHINYGIKTGYNEAFYLDAKQRAALIQEDPASEELIGKLLRGRDLERYKVNWQKIYQLIIKFGAHKSLERDYPAVYRHLLQHEKKLKARGQCSYGRARKSVANSKPYPGQHHWLEMDNNPGEDYLRLFSEPKILYQDIAQSLPFYFDEFENYYFNNTLWMINGGGDSLEYLSAVLNSTIFRCCFRDNFPEYSGNAYRMFAIFMVKIPIKKPDPEESKLFQKLIPLIQLAKRRDESAAALFFEDLIDACVMECYFREHMAERDLLFHEKVATAVKDFDKSASEPQQLALLSKIHATLNAPKHPVRNQLIRLTADSPELLGVVKEEGRV